MSDVPGRLYRIGKAYLDAAKGRLSEIDAQAQEELSKSLNRDDLVIPAPPVYNTASDPMERAAAKIAALRGQSAARQEAAPPSQAPQTDPVQTAYKILGVAPGSDWPTVQQTVNKLRERGAPSNFPDGSQEQTDAKAILERVEEAYQVLRNALDPTEGRFDRLEI